MKRLVRCWACAAPVAICTAMAAGDTLESVEKTIIQQGQKINSMSWKSTYHTDNAYGSTKMHSEGQSTYENMKKGEKVLYRMETAYTAVTETDGSKQTTKGTSLTICDGEFTYTYSDTAGTKSAMKQRAQAPVGGGVNQSYFDTMAQTYNLELLPDAKVGSSSTYVIRAVPKQSSPTMEGEQLLYFDKATGMMLKSVAKNTDGKVTMESTTTDLKIDPAISADRFVFQVPEGVTLMDLTQQAGSTEQRAEEAPPDDSAQPSAESETRTEEPTEEPKEEPAKKKKKEKKSKFPKLPKKKWP